MEVPVTKSHENTDRVVKLLKVALANLGPDIRGLSISKEDVASLTAEWTAVKSEDESETWDSSKDPLIVENVDDLCIQKKYKLLSDDSESDVVVLYCHGGAYM